MPKYLVEARYSTEGVRGIADKGGKMEGFYFAFGRADAYVFGELPDNETAAAIALAVNSDDRVGAKTEAPKRREWSPPMNVATPESEQRAREKDSSR